MLRVQICDVGTVGSEVGGHDVQECCRNKSCSRSGGGSPVFGPCSHQLDPVLTKAVEPRTSRTSGSCWTRLPPGTVDRLSLRASTHYPVMFLFFYSPLSQRVALLLTPPLLPSECFLASRQQKILWKSSFLVPANTGVFAGRT